MSDGISDIGYLKAGTRVSVTLNEDGSVAVEFPQNPIIARGLIETLRYECDKFVAAEENRLAMEKLMKDAPRVVPGNGQGPGFPESLKKHRRS